MIYKCTENAAPGLHLKWVFAIYLINNLHDFLSTNNKNNGQIDNLQLGLYPPYIFTILKRTSGCAPCLRTPLDAPFPFSMRSNPDPDDADDDDPDYYK